MKIWFIITFVMITPLLVACEQSEEAIDAMQLCHRHYQAESYQTAYQECQRAAEEGFAGADWLLGNLHEHGLGGQKADLKRAYLHYLKAAESGLTAAQARAGEMALYGRGIEPDYQIAWKWLNEAANNDSTEAKFSLAVLFLEGKGRSRDMSLAVHWFRQAAAQGHAMSINNLAWLYATSKNKPWFNPQKARRWFDKLTEMKELPAMFLDTGAAVAASEGDFELAVGLQKQAISKLTDEVAAETLKGYQNRLDAYLHKKRWVDGLLVLEQ